MGQRAEFIINIGSQYYYAADASIDYEWAVAIVFVSQACSLHHMLDLCIIELIALVHGKNGWIGEQDFFVRWRLHHRRYKLLHSSLALGL